MKKLLIAILSTSAALLLSSCATSNDDEATNSELLSRYLQQEIDWTSCSADLFMDKDYFDEFFDSEKVLCAQVKVPADYADLEPGNTEFTIQLPTGGEKKIKINKEFQENVKHRLQNRPGNLYWFLLYIATIYIIPELTSDIKSDMRNYGSQANNRGKEMAKPDFVSLVLCVCRPAFDLNVL